MATCVIFAILNKLGIESLPLGFTEMPLDYEYAIYPAAIASFLALILGSILTPASPEEKWLPFWQKPKEGE